LGVDWSSLLNVLLVRFRESDPIWQPWQNDQANIRLHRSCCPQEWKCSSPLSQRSISSSKCACVLSYAKIQMVHDQNSWVLELSATRIRNKGVIYSVVTRLRAQIKLARPRTSFVYF